MTEQSRILIYRIAMGLAWVSAIYGCLMIIDGRPENDTAGWIFFAVPIVLVVGERITRGDDEEDEQTASEGDDAGPTPPA